MLLVRPAGDARDKLVFALESRYHSTVVCENSAETALSFLVKEKAAGLHIDWLILDHAEAITPIGGKIREIIATVRTVLCTAETSPPPPIPGWNIAGSAPAQTLITSLYQVIDQNHERTASIDGYCKIRSKILLSVCPLRGDIFIKLSEKKYLKLFQEGDTFDLSDWTKYTEVKKIEYLYIRDEQCNQFIEKYKSELEQYLKPESTLTVDEAADMSNSVHETVHEMAKTMGFTKDVQLLAKTQIDLTVKTLRKSSDLSALLAKLEADNGRYLSSHSTLTGYLSTAIASQMEWGSDATMYKLNMAAFLHDITLSNPALAACRSLADVEKGNFTEKERTEYKKHPLEAADIARGFTEVPPDVDALILQHHEWPDGTGFPRGINQVNISPLASIFIVAHEMADQMLKDPAQFKVADFAKQFESQFSRGNFRKVMESVRQLRLDPPK